jgi:hypothetical protein
MRGVPPDSAPDSVAAMGGIVSVAVRSAAPAATPVEPSAAVPTAAWAEAPAIEPYLPPALPVTARANRCSGWRVSLPLLGLTLAVALASAIITLLLPSTRTELTLRRACVLALAQTWPAVPALALLWRWPAWQTRLALAAWACGSALLFAFNSDSAQPLRDAFVYHTKPMRKVAFAPTWSNWPQSSTRPGLSTCFGSSAFFKVRNRLICAALRVWARKGFLMKPMPCSALMVPRRPTSAPYTSVSTA